MYFEGYIQRERGRFRFIPHNGRSKAQLSKTDQFAEYLAEGLTVEQASERLGWQTSHGNAALQRIRKRLGPQAR